MLLEFGKKVCFQVGPQFGILIKGNEKGTISGKPVNDDLKDVMNKIDAALVAGIGFSPGNHFNLGARLNYGFTNIFKLSGNGNIDMPTIQNRVLHFYVACSF